MIRVLPTAYLSFARALRVRCQPPTNLVVLLDLVETAAVRRHAAADAAGGRPGSLLRLRRRRRCRRSHKDALQDLGQLLLVNLVFLAATAPRHDRGD